VHYLATLFGINALKVEKMFIEYDSMNL